MATFITLNNLFDVSGSNYWKLTRDSVAEGYPRRISQDWRGLPDNIDAAFTWESTRATYFIKVLFYLNNPTYFIHALNQFNFLQHKIGS